ncbi:FHA domain-containing protein [Pseudoalteromonas luteoviolacea]|uniref:FHA domain-containing protein n=1 Tax=Pseudoalteromonas luteoviolacea TaxID=43657 RepID=UPI001151B351|nr:FHA domain-containing protein [Pseudoalteromonas luteoviolacea]TQF66206.1 FHA domain-containing protein [Pseudoalteromonas luteoviolacea]
MCIKKNNIDTDFLALGLGGTNMMAMLWTIAMGKKAVGVEMRGDPFLRIHWNIRVDFYHQLGLIDKMMMERYGKEGVPHMDNGKLFSLAECFYSPNTVAGFAVPDEVVTGYDRTHHIAGEIHHVEFIDDRYVNGKPNRILTVLPQPETPREPCGNMIRTNLTEVLDGPSTFQSEANDVLVLLRRYLEGIEILDKETGREPRVQLFTTHRVVEESEGFVRGEDGRISVTFEKLIELDFRGKLRRFKAPDSEPITVNAPELCVIAQGFRSTDAERLGFEQKDVSVDHNDGNGPIVAQADYLAGFIDVLVDGRLRRRIASAFDDEGREYWVRQIAVGHENDPQVGWVLVQIPDFMVFDPVEAGYVSECTDKDSVEYFAAHQRLLYDFYIQESAKILEVPEEELRGIQMAYGPKQFSLIERIGDSPKIAPNVQIAGDSFGNGHFLTSGGAMAGMVGHSMAVLNYWKARAAGVSVEEASDNLAEEIRDCTQSWLDVSAKEFTSFAPINFGADRIQKIADESGIEVDARTKLVDASRRRRHGLSPLDPSDWRRPALRNGRVRTSDLPPLKDEHPDMALV